jgi:hypothetical protein
VDVSPKPLAGERFLDVDALAGGLQLEVANRLAAMVAYLAEHVLETEAERAALVAAALRHMDGLEAAFVRELRRELGGAPVA